MKTFPCLVIETKHLKDSESLTKNTALKQFTYCESQKDIDNTLWAYTKPLLITDNELVNEGKRYSQFFI